MRGLSALSHNMHHNNARKTWRVGAIATAMAFVLGLLVLPQSALAKYASLVMDASTGRVLHSVNADTRNYPASLTKMMTLYMIFEALNRGVINEQTEWTASKRVARQPASKLGLKKGETLSVRDSILALVTKSANDVATLAAEGLAGSERDFALAMTAKARKLGMSRTTFRNASGLPNKGQFSTARDMAVLAQALLRDFPGYYHVFATASFKYDGRKFKNHNKLLTSYEGTDGIKTGYIRASGFNLVASVKRGGQRLIGVVFGGDSSAKRNRHMISLLDKGFRILNGGEAVASTDAPTPTVTRVVSSSNANEASSYDPKLSWGIQIGAFADEDRASNYAHEVSAIVPKLLNTGFVTVVPLKKKSGKVLYRSRIHNIPKKQAYMACRILISKNINCMEIRLTKGQQLAALN
ncbi:MAG: D-alanyl-D-alanine carboxypeptidase [Rhodospirillales bacterium]|nr:D-alanyl-D-alanine carboxypeptidase [Rhodospirillales bacterium]